MSSVQRIEKQAQEVDSEDLQFLSEQARLWSLEDLPRNLMEIPLLTKDDRDELLRRKSRLENPRPKHRMLFSASAEEIVAEGSWNPSRREFSPIEMEVLGKLIKEHRFFGRQAMQERVLTDMKPLVPELDAAGAYVEYASKSEPPPVPMVNGELVISMTAPGGEAGTRRIYYFYPQDFPDLYHRRQVESDRSLETYVEVAELLRSQGE